MFKIDRELLKIDGFGQLQAFGDELLEKRSLENYEIHVRPATEKEKQALMELGFRPEGAGLDYFNEDEKRFTVSYGALMPVLDSFATAESLIQRLLRHVDTDED